jgi:hypothetical protein
MARKANKPAKAAATVRNEQTTAQEPDDLHKLVIDCTHNAVQTQGLQDRFLKLGQSYCDEAGVMDVERFKKDCETQENWLTSDKAGALKVDRLPGPWRTAKSQLLRAVRPVSENGAGKSLTEFNSFYELRKALPKQARKPRTPAATAVEAISERLTAINAQLNAIQAKAAKLSDKALDALEAELKEVNEDIDNLAREYPVSAEPKPGQAVKAEGILDDEGPETEGLTPDEETELRERLRHH